MNRKQRRAMRKGESIPKLTIRNDVRELIGPAGVQTAEDAWLRGHTGNSDLTCWICGSRISPQSPEPGEVSLESAGAQAAIRFSHARCGSGRVFQVEELSMSSDPPSIAFQPYCIPEKKVAVVFWETPNQAIVAGDETIDDGESLVWLARGALSISQMDSVLHGERDEFPVLENTYARYVKGSGLEVWFSPAKDAPGEPALAVQFDGASSFEGPWLQAASQAGEIRMALMTDVMRQALGAQEMGHSLENDLPDGAVIAGRVPFSAI